MWGTEEDIRSADPVWQEIDSIRRARGLPDEARLPDVVAESWKRCLADYKLLPDRVPRAEVLDHSEIRLLLEEREEFLRIAEPEVERLFSRLVHSEYLVSLASQQGAMLLFRCDYQYLGELAGSGVIPGSVWSEEQQGTNGVGTCLRVGKSVSIIGRQHYGAATQALTCLTAPVFGREGAIESVINVTSARAEVDARMNKVVQSIVERSARRIENSYFGRVHRRKMQLRLVNNGETMDLAEEGRLALDDTGRIVDGSSHVARLLGCPVDRLIGATAENLFDLDTALCDLRPDRPVSLSYQGRTLQAVLTAPETRVSMAAPMTVVTMPAPERPGLRARRDGLQTPEDLHVDPVSAQAMDRAQRLLSAGLPLIVLGETGTGKSVFAQTIARRCFGEDGELIFIDCASLDRGLEASGILQGCLTRPHACLIFDRVNELGEAGQAALLSLLESDRQSGRDRLGIIVITCVDLEQLMKDGKLRSDLFHRLKGGAITLPPLRGSPDMAGTLHALFQIERRALGRPALELDDEVRLVLGNYYWPGNLRQARLALRHAIALADGNLVRLNHLPGDIVDEIARKDLTARSQSEACKIEAALRYNGGNVSLTARYLGVSRATLYRKIQIQKAREEP